MVGFQVATKYNECWSWGSKYQQFNLRVRKKEYEWFLVVFMWKNKKNGFGGSFRVIS
jgi:hypothetical protein